MGSLRTLLLAAAIVWMVGISNGVAVGEPLTQGHKIYPAYKAKSGACYVLLKPNNVQVLGEDNPVCPAPGCDEAFTLQRQSRQGDQSARRGSVI